ncbi:hypothetical protein BegalDRAFT_2827 [Beggiatoa alba B18LD]|uniref:Effector-associated domain-containing protein n=1 Tax=Beggiatoa alba B18LD TaxID=395493 RepID=I3CJ68_9GAMM|nr:hypothetical protein [Beggiatoa alba]EIJ43661.1 hypothetical protein BegalDRAFT_2827 [Beggiatoa alba B18LD]
MPNPFVTTPAEFKQFINHKLLIQYLIGLWKDYPNMPVQSAAIWGVHGSGKSSILHHLRNLARNPIDTRFRVEQQQVFPKNVLITFVSADLSDFTVNNRAKLLNCLIKQMPFYQEGMLSVTNNPLEEFYDIVRDCAQYPLIFLLDNVDKGITYYPSEFDRSFWESLRSLAIADSGGIGFIITSERHPALITELLGDEPSDFFNIFGYTFKVEEAFEEEDALKLTQLSDIPFTQEDIDFILTKSQRRPALLQCLCSLCYQHKESGSHEDWRKAANDVISNVIREVQESKVQEKQKTERRQELQKCFNQYFSFREVKSVIFKLNIDEDELENTTKRRLVETLIVYCEQREQTEQLVQILKAERPEVDEIQSL